MLEKSSAHAKSGKKWETNDQARAAAKKGNTGEGDSVLLPNWAYLQQLEETSLQALMRSHEPLQSWQLQARADMIRDMQSCTLTCHLSDARHTLLLQSDVVRVPIRHGQTQGIDRMVLQTAPRICAMHVGHGCQNLESRFWTQSDGFLRWAYMLSMACIESKKINVHMDLGCFIASSRLLIRVSFDNPAQLLKILSA
eukprot:2720476-Amphidinium_carterae.1